MPSQTALWTHELAEVLEIQDCDGRDGWEMLNAVHAELTPYQKPMLIGSFSDDTEKEILFVFLK